MVNARTNVFIGSTKDDLKEYRTAVREAILNLGLFPNGMENWSVEDETAVELCRRKMDESEIYVGIYAYRYGWQPSGHGGKSITEMEYDWATVKGIPRLCFIVDDNYPWAETKKDAATKANLDAFKSRVREGIVGFFTTPDDLKAQVTAAIAKYSPRIQLNGAIPYLRWLHEQSKKSGLLNVLNPRDAISSSNIKPITVELVYTPLNTHHIVTRNKNGRILSHAEVEELKRHNKTDDLQQTPMSVIEAASMSPRLVLLGDAGSGKSIFINFMALCLSGHLIDPDGDWLGRLQLQGWSVGSRFPILVPLRNFAQDIEAGKGTAGKLLDYIERQLEKWRLSDTFPVIQEALNDGRALVLLDGLDEVPGEWRDVVREAVTDLMERCNSGNHYLITCRILSYSNPEWRLTGMAEETIADFNEEQIGHFINTWFNSLVALEMINVEIAQKRIDDLTQGLRDSELANIASNPMLLTVMAIIHNHTGALPRESARLYDECVKLLMGRWRSHEARDLLEVLNVREDDLYRLLWEIAYDAHDKQADREGAADIPEPVILGIARNSLGDMTKALEFCEYVEKQAGLLIGRGQDSYGIRMFTFPHRTFQEYLAGCYVANNSFWELAPELARRTGWREVLMLATGHLVFNQGRIDIPLLAINELTPAEELPRSEEDWRCVWLAGDILALIGEQSLTTSKSGPRLLKRVRERLMELVGSGYLPPIERAAAGRSLGLLGDLRKGVGLRQDGLPDIDWVEIFSGEFLMGSDRDIDLVADESEMPQHRVMLPTYYISRYPITYQQFDVFLNASDGFVNTHWWHGIPEQYHKQPVLEQYFKFSNHPRDTINWYHVVAFCRWLSTKLGYEVRLPTESEWEKAARGTASLIYPYGNQYDISKSNDSAMGIEKTSAVGIFPQGESLYGVMDMSGNIWEWCSSRFMLYPYENKHPRESLEGSPARILRGGSWESDKYTTRCASRNWSDPSLSDYRFGFRVVSTFPFAQS